MKDEPFSEQWQTEYTVKLLQAIQKLKFVYNCLSYRRRCAEQLVKHNYSALQILPQTALRGLAQRSAVMDLVEKTPIRNARSGQEVRLQCFWLLLITREYTK
ncbi:hypothetical protein J6590_005288 [Homalodisca vitripennis]|nr:hypothetical protein J6590_005288 [Homalodisca vitripennis]